MAYDGKLLARARAELENRRAVNQAEQQRRLSEVYYRVPEIRELDLGMQSHMAQLVRITLSRSPDMKAQINALKDENLSFQARKLELLTENGYPTDFLSEINTCPKCKDTGNLESGICSCLKELYNRELTKDLAVLMKKGNESFDSFDFNLYDNVYDPRNQCVPREAMKLVYALSKKFADNFPDVSSNLLLHGGTGLGKTYLSACIARTVSGKGYSVCYDTAASALEAFEKQKFSRGSEEGEAASSRVERMLSCDLMILDDLGTEMITPMTKSALYTLINTRLVNSKPTIISTNLDIDEFEDLYNAQIASRIQGEFLDLKFAGRDIRLLRKEL